MGHQGFASRTPTRKRNQDKHREEGKCLLCSRKVKKGRTRCEYHLKYQREHRRDKKTQGKRNRESGQRK